MVRAITTHSGRLIASAIIVLALAVGVDKCDHVNPPGRPGWPRTSVVAIHHDSGNMR